MSCELYWRDGILRVERDEPDPHRDGCVECQREHQARAEIIRALPLLAEGELGDPNWQAGVWARIARQEQTRPHMRWFVGSMMATAAVLVLASWAVLRDRGDGAGSETDGPVIEVMSGPMATRAVRSAHSSSTATVGDQVKITVKPGEAVRIYHDNTLVLACPAGTTSGGCVSDGRGLTAEARLQTPGAYELVVITPESARDRAGGGPASTGGLAKDLETLVEAGYSYQLTQLWVP
jgi:hypothetical protein